MMNIKKYRIFIAFLFLLLLYTLYKLYLKSRLSEHEWTMSDWLINYQDGGFKRRGLSGSLIFWIQDVTTVPLNIIVYIIQFSLYCLLFYGIIKLLNTKKLDWNIVVMTISPLCLTYIAINVANSGRKEIILFAIICYFSLGKMSKFKEIITLLLYCISLFLHEAFYFYLPFFLAIHYLKKHQINMSYYFAFLSCSTIIMFLLYNGGIVINYGNSIEIIKKRGIIFGNFNVFTSNIVFVKEQLISYILFIIELFVVIVLFGYYIHVYYKNYYKKFLSFIFVSLLFVSPLFYMGVDWFRWIHIYCTLLLFLVILILPNLETKNDIFNGNKTLKIFICTVPILFILFFFHVQYDAVGGSIEKVKRHYNKKLENIVKPLNYFLLGK